MAEKIEEEDLSTKLLNCKLTDEEKEKLSEKGYKILHIINEGTCSLVYLAEFQEVIIDGHEVQRNVAMKLACKVTETGFAPKEFVKKFLLRELDIVSQISHPHIIHTHSILHLNTKIMVFMRNAELGNLCDFIINYGALREKQARIWFRQLAVALGYLHTINVAHRDIKCSNILITHSFNIKLCDFDFGRFCADKKGNPVYSMTFCGSIAYAAPELIKEIPYDPPSTDIWSSGIVLYVMLNGIMPFKTDNLENLWNAQMNRHYRYRASVIARIPREVIDLISGMLEPLWFERMSIYEVLRSEWFSMEPSLLRFAPKEQEALDRVQNIKPSKNVKIIKKIMRRNKYKKKIEMISKEDIEEPSDETIQHNPHF